jgi:hypothetical protein
MTWQMVEDYCHTMLDLDAGSDLKNFFSRWNGANYESPSALIHHFNTD